MNKKIDRNNLAEKEVIEIPFVIDYPFIIRMFIEKEYEKICEFSIPHEYVEDKFYDRECGERITFMTDDLEGTEIQIQAKCDAYAFGKVKQIYQFLSDEAVIEELKDYMSSIYPDRETIVVNIEDIHNFSKYVYDRYKQTNDYKKERIRKMLLYHESYVYDKKTEKFELVPFGKHFQTIRLFLMEYFLNNSNLITDHEKSFLEFGAFPHSFFDQADVYISENIVMKGTYQNKGIYKFNKIYK